MVGRNGDDEAFLIEGLGHEARVGDRVGHDGDVDGARAQLGDELGGVRLLKVDGHLRGERGELHDELGHEVRGDRVDHAEADRAGERILTALGDL